MKVLMISTDRSILDKNSEARQRMVEYGKLAEKLRIVILSRPFQSLKIGRDIKGFDLITTQDPFETGLIGWILAKIFGAPLQIQIHTDFLSPFFVRHSMLNRLRVMIAKFLIPRANCIRVVSDRIKSSLLSTFHILSSKILILPIFVDTEKIKNAPIKTNLHHKYPQFDFVILMASRLTKEKNIGLAMEAFTEIVKEYPRIGLIIVGSGPEKKNLKINENIIIENWTNDLTSYYKTADLFLLTSNYEGYGRTLVEAAAAGCKIISSDVGVAAEILPKENIFEVGNKEQLKGRIIRAIRGELAPAKTIKAQTKEEYLETYKKSWEICGF